MKYRHLPVKDCTYERLLKVVKAKETWDETINRIIDNWEASKPVR
jgi:hypothetical protein